MTSSYILRGLMAHSRWAQAERARAATEVRLNELADGKLWRVWVKRKPDDITGISYDDMD